ncbi:MAG: SH3 domain-containing protein [Saprospiraceae bacterium]
MEKVFLMITFTLLSVFLQGQGDSLHVAARNGLLVRTSPKKGSAIIGKLKYNELVKIIEVDNFDTIDYRVAPWFKVAKDTILGYVFGGYLNKYPLPENEISSLRSYLHEIVELYDVEFENVYQNDGKKFDVRNVVIQGSKNHLLINEFGYEWGVFELNLYDWGLHEVINIIELTVWFEENVEYRIFEKSIDINNLDRFRWINGFDDPEGVMVLEKRYPKGIRIIKSSSL